MFFLHLNGIISFELFNSTYYGVKGKILIRYETIRLAKEVIINQNIVLGILNFSSDLITRKKHIRHKLLTIKFHATLYEMFTGNQIFSIQTRIEPYTFTFNTLSTLLSSFSDATGLGRESPS